jgi:hypothetical protein
LCHLGKKEKKRRKQRNRKRVVGSREWSGEGRDSHLGKKEKKKKKKNYHPPHLNDTIYG